MKFLWERLAEHLRTELGELGGLLRLVELYQVQEAQDEPFTRLQTEAALDAQAAALRACRIRRLKITADFLPATETSLPTIINGRILEEVTPDARPLLQALSEEIERLDQQFHELARGLPAATQRKLEQILKIPPPAPKTPLKRPAAGPCLPANSR